MKGDPPKAVLGSSSGATPTERFLYAHCQRSYLQLWSYANVFRDQGKGGGRTEGKELCDVLVVLGDAVILFSDKNSAFPNTGNEDLDWRRWHRRAIEASRIQLAGAERWIRSHPDRIFLDRECTKRVPVALPGPEKMRVFKVCVALGASARCRKRHPGCSGSLMLVAVLPDEQMHAPPVPTFAVNLVDSAGDIVHVLDEVTLPVVLDELDTLPDLIEYLETKESLIRQKRVSSIAGEEDLVGLFLGTRAGIAELDFAPDVRLAVGEGIYADVISRPEYLRHKRATQPSYFWDGLIAYHSACALMGKLAPGSCPTVKENEEILRFLAAQPRLCRRYLSIACLDLYKTAPRHEVTSRVMKGFGDVMFVFQIVPSGPRLTIEDRESRREDLKNYCLLTAWRNRAVKTIVGICANGISPDRDAFDLVALEVPEWTDEAIAAGQKVSEAFANEVSSPLAEKQFALPHPLAWKPWDLRHSNRRRIAGRNQRRRWRKKERQRRRN